MIGARSASVKMARPAVTYARHAARPAATALAKQWPFSAGPEVHLHGVASRARNGQRFAVPRADDARPPCETFLQRRPGRDEVERHRTRHEPNAAIDHGQCVASEERLLRTI